MKKKNKYRILRFTLSCFATAVLCTTPLHFFSSKGMGPLPWKDIMKAWPFILFLSLLFATEFTFERDDKEPFWKRFKKKDRDE